MAEEQAGAVSSFPGCLCVLCGLPAAGKSALTLSLRGEAERRGWRVAVASYDNLIPQHAFGLREAEDSGKRTQIHTEWKLHRRAVLQGIEQLLISKKGTTEQPKIPGLDNVAWQQCIRGLQQPADHAPLVFILDDNFYYQSMRYEVCQLARKYSAGFCQVYLQCDSEVCISRNLSRSEPVPTEVILDMVQRLEPPNPQRNSWEMNSVALNTAETLTSGDIQTVMELISTAIKNPLLPVEDNSEQKEADRLKCINSVVHQADQTCRRLISETMKSARGKHVPSEGMRTLAAQLNEDKAGFLQDLRKDFLQIRTLMQDEDVDRVVNRAVEAFDVKRKELELRIINDGLKFEQSPS